MDCQQQVVEASNIIVLPSVNIHVMVVDDDSTSLAVVSSLLKTLNYEVSSVKDPIRALYMLRAGKQSFDLVITSLYMSKMDGFELTRRVNGEFELPVIMISNDDRESVMFRAIQEGVVLYLLKPFSPNDIKNIWQFAITTKTRSKPNPNLFIEESRSQGVEFRAVVEAHSVSSSNEVMSEKKKKKKNSKGKGGNQENKSNDKKEKKAKMVWTDFLQYRFLQAVHYIGLDRAVPKKILEVMNVPGLTRENVASHLQKYRIFLRKVAEKCMITTNKSTSEEILWSKFLSQHASFVLEKIQQKRTIHLNSSQNPNPPLPFSTHQNSNPNNLDHHRSTCRSSSFATNNLLPYSLGHTPNFVSPPLPMNQNDFNFYGAQFQNLADGSNYLGSNFSSNNNNNYYAGYSVGVDGGISVAPNGVSNGNYVGFDHGMGVGNFRGFEAVQRNEFGQYGIGFGGENYSYNNNGGLMSNYNGINFGGDSQITVRHSSHAHDNKEQGSVYTADGGTPITDHFSIDDLVLDEFLASCLRNDNSAQG